METSTKRALDRYLLRTSPDYRRDRERFGISAAVTLASLILSSIDLISIPILKRDFFWLDAVAILVFAGSLYFFFIGLSARYEGIDRLAPKDGFSFYSFTFPPRLGVTVLDKGIYVDHDALYKKEADRILKILPNSRARRLGFEQVFPKFGCDEVGHRSKDVDEWLLTDPKVPVEFGGSGCQLPAPNHEQCQFLYHKISGPSRTTDDEKVGMISDIEVGMRNARIVKRTYFDSLISNEIFRSTLFQKPEKANYSGELVSDFSEIKEQPSDELGQALFGLESMKAANHIGASVFALSADRYPIFFEQGNDQEEGAGTLVVSGTGSADWNDRYPLDENINFFDIPKRTMVREFAEEAELWETSVTLKTMHDRLGSKGLAIDEFAKSVTLIGYFRWVSRFGKPEFLGVTRTDVNLNNLGSQKEEVVQVRGGLGLHRQINSMEELRTYLQKVRETLEGSERIGLGLSSAMLLHRLLEISEAGSDEAKLRIADALGIRR